MEKYLFMGGMMLVSAMVIPQFMDARLEQSQQKPGDVLQISKTENQTPKKQTYNPLDGRKSIIKMDNRGHFVASARLNGRRMNVLVDTGATSVAINESTARKLGIHLKPSDFKYKVRTANGVTKAASAIIDEIEIGRVRITNVRASVSKDSSLNVVLLGMAFLKELRKFEVTNGELILTQ